MLRKERKLNHVRGSVKTINGKKSDQKKKPGTKNKAMNKNK